MKTFKNKKCLITGASSGLGLELTKLFIKAEAEVIMLCRNEKKSRVIIESLLKDYPDAKIQLEIADFSSLSSLMSFIKRFRKRNSSIDILINNAGVLKSKISKTEDGFESMFQVNYLAPFLLTNSLIDLLKSGNNPQILNIALPPDKMQLNFDDLQSLNKFKPMDNLFKSKLCLFIYSMELVKRMNNSGVKVITGIPNNRPFKSNLGREMPFLMGLAWSLITVKTEKIAGNIPFVLSQQDLKNGFVFKGSNAVSVTPYSKDSDIQNCLRKETEKMLEFYN